MKSIKYIGVAIISSALTLAVMFSQKSIAQSTSSVFTGSCGLLVNRNFGGWEANYRGDNTVAQNFIGIINFDTKKINFAASVISNYGNDPAVASMPAPWLDEAFTIADGPFPGAYSIIADDGQKAYTIIPVSSGNTFLLVENNNQSVATGMCQKI